jgi:transposase-like protein
MVLTSVKCPHCESENVIKNGTSENDKQRFLCRNESCAHRTFIESYTNRACDPEVRQRIFFLTVNGNGQGDRDSQRHGYRRFAEYRAAFMVC